MNASMREHHWEMTARKRRRPGAGECLLIPFDSSGAVDTAVPQPPTSLALETTSATGELADWLDDNFWVAMLQAWSNERLSIQILPTPEALLHEVVLHHLHMLRRVAPHWRLVGECYVNDLSQDGLLAQAALSPYHELRIRAGARSGQPQSGHPLRLEDALARIRRVQVANSRSTPIVVCDQPAATPPRPPSAAAAGVPMSKAGR